jgi:hypothetical protein
VAKRARYDGPWAKTRVSWPPGETAPEYEALVEKGHLLPADAPAKLRDSLVADNPDWAEVEHASGKKESD